MNCLCLLGVQARSVYMSLYDATYSARPGPQTTSSCSGIHLHELVKVFFFIVAAVFL